MSAGPDDREEVKRRLSRVGKVWRSVARRTRRSISHLRPEEAVPREWVLNLKSCTEQFERELRALEEAAPAGAASAAACEPPADPLDGLKVLRDDDEAA